MLTPDKRGQLLIGDTGTNELCHISDHVGYKQYILLLGMGVFVMFSEVYINKLYS